jgi:hypothetical protein
MEPGQLTLAGPASPVDWVKARERTRAQSRLRSEDSQKYKGSIQDLNHHCRASPLLFQQGVTLLDQLVELFLLLGNPIGRSFFILRAGRAGGLFDQLSQVVLKYRDAVVEFRYRKRIVVTHFRYSFSYLGFYGSSGFFALFSGDYSVTRF